jgi:glyceraldehyde-3-phosphate dehydrogenase/erythrose-4-phosphate dehydrogenase
MPESRCRRGFEGILEYTEDPIVSSDVKETSIPLFLSSADHEVGPNFFQVMSWTTMSWLLRQGCHLAKKLLA